MKLQGRVTFIDDRGRLFTIQEGAKAARIDLGVSLPQLRVGEKVEVTGITSPGDFFPAVLGATVQVVDEALQIPAAIPLMDLKGNPQSLDYLLVEIAGIQRARTFNAAGRAVIDVETAGGLVQATCFLAGQENAPQWQGHRVRARGILRTIRDLRGGRIRSEIWLPGWGFILPDEPAVPEAAGSTDLPTLRNVASIRALSSDEAARSYPVHLEGAVTYVTPQGHEFFLQDATGGVYVRRVMAEFWPIPGDRVELDGHSVRGNLMTDVAPVKLRKLGRSGLPVPAKAGIDEILAGRQRAAWVEVEGFVVSVEFASGTTAVASSRGLNLLLLAQGSRIPVTLSYPSGDLPEHWIGARIRLRGVCGSIFNQRRQSLGIRLLVPGAPYVTVVDPTPAGSPPKRWISELLQVHTEAEPRVQVEGIVTLPASEDLGGFYMQDQTGGVLVLSQRGESVRAGDRLEVIGFPLRGELGPVLQSASYRSIGGGPRLNPPSVLPEEAVRGDYDSQLVRIEGYIANQDTRSRRQEFTLHAGNRVFTASLSRLAAPHVVPAIRMGSLVQVTGVCTVHTTHDGMPDSFRILLRSPGDVQVLEQASWWTRDHMSAALGLTASLVLSALAWISLLRRRVRQQTALIEQKEKRYRSLVENAPDIVYSCDAEGNLTSVNQAAAHLTGYTCSELLRMNLVQLATPEYSARVRKIWERGAAGEELPAREIEFLTKDGRRLLLEAKHNLVSLDGEPASIQGILRDVSERHRLEEQLLQSQKMEALGHLAGGVAHHFNNLLTSILGYCELLINRTPSNHRDYPMLTVIRKSGREAALITAQLLAFGRKQIRSTEVLDVPSVISGLEQILRTLIGIEIQLVVSVDPQLGRIVADEGQIRQVITNLVINAREAMPAGGRVTIRAARCRHSGDELCGPDVTPVAGHYVHLSVSDTGRGIRKELQRKIFEPFYTTKEVSHGTGLGLSTVEGIVSQSGGHIWVDSALGQGSTFTICLPALSGQVASFRTSQLVVSAGAAGQSGSE